MNIKQKHEETHGIFYVESGGKTQALLNYIKPGTKNLVITNTDIMDKNLKDQGVGKELVQAIVNFARDEDLKLRSFCPYAEYLLEHEKEYQDVYKAA